MRERCGREGASSAAGAEGKRQMRTAALATGLKPAPPPGEVPSPSDAEINSLPVARTSFQTVTSCIPPSLANEIKIKLQKEHFPDCASFPPLSI